MTIILHLRGVGGQALPLIVSMLGRRAADAGATLTSREVFGMAQRGGSVFATLDIALNGDDGPASDSSPSILLGFELLEGIRGFTALRPGQQAFVSTARIVPPGSWDADATPYPSVEEAATIAAQFGIMLHLVEASAGAPWKVVQAAIDAQALPLGARSGVRVS
ncbi:MAG: 2-oxoacid:acceptor oxidoreductase family protein [Chloroflexota bacterium]